MLDGITMSPEKVIAEVKKFPFLYDPRHAEYRSILKKAQAWRGIGKKLNQDVETVKLKWRNCRDAYLKYKRISKGARNQTVIRYKSWPWTKNMKFMDSILEARLGKSNALTSGDTVAGNSRSQPNQQSASKALSSVRPSSPDTETSSEDDCAVDILPSSMFSNVKLQSKKIRKEGLCDHCVTSYIQNKQNSEDKDDEVEHLFLSYAKTFKRFTVRSQAKLKVQLAELFAETELAELDKQGATQISSSLSITNSACIDVTEPFPPSDVTPVSVIKTGL